MFGIEWAWLAPAVCLCAFALLVVFRSILPRAGAYISILAIAGGFILFWFFENLTFFNIFIICFRINSVMY